MPLWGRPSGARQGMKRKEWERQQREWEAQRRFQEIDSESDDHEHSPGLDRQFPSDELYFTGADLGRLSRDRRTYEYSDDSEDTYDDDDYDDDMGNGGAMQIALREKEEVLVERAMERIRRAQMLGKPHVKLTAPERDALARKMENDQDKSKRPALKSKSNNLWKFGSRSNTSQTALVPTATKRKSRLSFKPTKADSGRRGQPSPSRVMVAGSDGQQHYAPMGDYPPPRPGNSPYPPFSQPGSRSTSTHSLQHPAPPTQYRSPPKRYYSVPEQHHPYPSRPSPPPRPMPDEPNWQPRPRSSPGSPYPPDFRPYQVYSPRQPPLPHQYPYSDRRYASGPPDIGYPSLQPAPPNANPYAYSTGNSEDDTEYDYDDTSVQVDVDRGYTVNVSTRQSGSGASRQRKVRR